MGEHQSIAAFADVYSGEQALSERIFAIHEQLRIVCADISRIAVAVYDESSGMVRTFIESTDGGSPLVCYARPLSEVPSLGRVAAERIARVIDDLSELAGSNSEHSRALLARGYASSYTVPLYSGEQLLGFVFFDASERHAFSAQVRARLMVYTQLLSVLIAHDRASVQTLLGAVHTASYFSHFRDEETGAHIARVARYARLIARGLADDVRPNDEFIEYLFQFAPLHDLGKIAIPDQILLKPGRLDADEMRVMKTHVNHGAALVDTMVREFDLGSVHHVQMLRNIILYHHENVDGSGYPDGLAGTAIPLEARIVKVADVFDALTTVRPYKKAWPLDQACAHLREHAGRHFDAQCVEALLACPDEIEAIRLRFVDERMSGTLPH